MNDYSLGMGIKIRTHRRRFPLRPFFFLCILALCIGAALWIRNTSPRTSASQDNTQPSVSDNPTTIPPIQQSDQTFIASLRKETEKLKGTVSVYILDITHNKEWGVNEHTMLTAASVNKIPILATLYHKAQTGDIDLEKIITLQASDIQDFGTGSMRYDKPGTVYSIKTMARLMMEKSDNTAAYILSNHILGIDTIQTYVNEFGISQTNIEENTTSAKDMAKILISMYTTSVTSPALTEEMMGFMDQTDFDDRIPAGVDPGIKVFHKTGDEINKIHDVGIIELPGRPYYLGILTTDQTDEEQTKEIIRSISRLTFSYMKSL